MKNLKAFLNFLKKNPAFVEDFSDTEDVFAQFQEPVNKKIKICYAAYMNEAYEGSAMVIYYDPATKKYFEVYGSHCSCYGLEDQWLPSEVTMEALLLRINDGYFYDGDTFKNMYLKYMQAK